ncbi:recombinase RecT [Paraburkholderia terrae]|uniref:recombinase RecT n=1 Tax=Paraburkholderia terrae TaxID=311230 RepID=UPI001EE2D663|nr:recombinase RecT [Paraburkholderia terrae]GJH00261.1 recombinase RecT [Paraburkholderia terrae]
MSDQQKEPLPLTEAQWIRQESEKIGTFLKSKRGDQLAAMLPEGISVDKFIGIVTTAVVREPKLLDADRASLYTASLRAATDGLLPDGREAVLNVYDTKKSIDGRDVWVPTVQYLPMVRGILKVMRNSGEVVSVDAAAVYDKDQFRFVRGDDPRIEHEPYGGEEDPGKIKAAYMIVKLASGEVQREVMWSRDIEKVRGASKTGNGANSPWTKWYDQMAIKSVIKRGAKLLPASSERLERVLQHDNDAMGFDFGHRDDAPMIDAAELPAATPAPAKPAAPALPNEVPQQKAARSRFAGIINGARGAQIGGMPV